MKPIPTRLAAALVRRIRTLYLSLGSGRTCPVCGWSGHAFLRRSTPHKPAPGEICPSCGSSQRHRFAYVALQDRLPAHADKTLHFAPERCIAPWLRSISRDYLSVDLSSPRAMQHMDITCLPLPDAGFSLVWCSHVLEHIEDDGKAIAELFRVLRPGGAAVIMVPVYGDSTYEDPSIRSPQERLKHFKQEDHVRLYGLDVADRLRSAGFAVEVLRVADLPAALVERQALDYPSTREVFFCTRPG